MPYWLWVYTPNPLETDWFFGGGYLFTTLCRIAVPFFFVTSGFLFFSRCSSINKYVKRLIVLDIAWTVIEFPFIIYKCFIISDYSNALNIFHLFQSLLWGESYMGSWFIHASWQGMLLLCWMTKYMRAAWVRLICIVFFVLALIDTSYQFCLTPVISSRWSQITDIILPSESFIVAVPYFYIGKILSEQANKLSESKQQNWVFLCLFFILLFVEAIIVRRQSDLSNIRYEQFIVLLPFTYYFVKILCVVRTNIPDISCIRFRKLSILVFLIHQPIIIVVYKLTGFSTGLFLYTVVSLVSITISYLILLAAKKIKALNFVY